MKRQLKSQQIECTPRALCRFGNPFFLRLIIYGLASFRKHLVDRSNTSGGIDFSLLPVAFLRIYIYYYTFKNLLVE